MQLQHLTHTAKFCTPIRALVYLAVQGCLKNEVPFVLRSECVDFETTLGGMPHAEGAELFDRRIRLEGTRMEIQKINDSTANRRVVLPTSVTGSR